MEKKTVGAWIIHHTHKLKQTDSVSFDNIALAGKAGILLSALSESSLESTLSRDKVSSISRAQGISPNLELPSILKTLKDHKLIDQSSGGDVTCIGLTTASVLSHTHDIYKSASPGSHEEAALELAEKVSQFPCPESAFREYIGDQYKFSSEVLNTFISNSEAIGFVDYEQVESDQKLYFNGNLFRRDDAVKASSIIKSLSSKEQSKVIELQSTLKATVCIPYSQAIKLLGRQLFEKLHAIGMFDVHTVSNEKESIQFISSPAAFQKFGNPLVEDALDLAKAFASSITYGMTYSTYGRGRITMFKALMDKLLRGEWVGPATAIGQDYKVLEMKRVVEVRPEASGMFSMRLLKQDIGELTAQAINEGDVSEKSLPGFYGASITGYSRPEENREIARKRQVKPSKRETFEILRTIRESE
jgi:hypothetical protein